ncbi:MAG: aldo/keto reductase, partial [Candidatus Omnitrophica bacterium]|nr:aldo/keto reductase [Candidatus Omnitrophota bacterium]
MNSKKPISARNISRREFLGDSALLTAGLAAGLRLGAAPPVPPGKIPSYNEKMEYRRLGKTDLIVSRIGMGGHWKRLDTMVSGLPAGEGYASTDYDKVRNTDFARNRHDIVSRCLEHGINYVDACAGPEIMAYSAALKGRRDKMYLGYSWYEKEPRFAEWRTAARLLQGLDEGMKQAGLDYIDVWRISCFTEGSQHTQQDIEAVITALATAKKQGKVRATGISSHDRPWLKEMIEKYPDQIEVFLTPYTANSKILPTDSLFDSVRKNNVGVFGIKPFASNSLFK